MTSNEEDISYTNKTYKEYTDNLVSDIEFATEFPSIEQLKLVTDDLVLFKQYYGRKYIPVNVVKSYYDDISKQLVKLIQKVELINRNNFNAYLPKLKAFTEPGFKAYVNNKDSFGQPLPKSPTSIDRQTSQLTQVIRDKVAKVIKNMTSSETNVVSKRDDVEDNIVINQIANIQAHILNSSFTSQEHLNSEISYLEDLLEKTNRTSYIEIKPKLLELVKKLNSKIFEEGTIVRSSMPKFLYSKLNLTKLKKFALTPPTSTSNRKSPKLPLLESGVIKDTTSELPDEDCEVDNTLQGQEIKQKKKVSMNPEDEIKKIIITQYGADNLNKVMRNERDGPIESKKRFLAKYPYARVEKFTFGVDLDDKGDIEKYTVYYKYDNDGDSYDITSQTFLTNKEWVKDLQYSWVTIWGDKGTLQPFNKTGHGISFDVNKIRIYVTNELFFDAEFEGFKLKNTNTNDISDNSYLAAMFAAYIATYVCGICTKHFEYNDTTPNIITSIARYHLYYLMKRFLRAPEKMNKYITSDMRNLIIHSQTIKYVYEKRFASTHEEIHLWLRQQKHKDKIHHARYAKNTHGNIVGIHYDYVVSTTNARIDEYKLFIPSESSGLTKTGQLLFQQSVQSYVYTVLGAQASTRWPIVGRGAMSLQTQSVYLQKVKDTIVQDDQTVLISDMRKAIYDTNVVLNMAITPGMILIPSSMIILEEKIPGYNNILKLAEPGMRFGVNNGVNYYSEHNNKEDDATKEVKTEVKTTTTTPTTRKPVNNTTGKQQQQQQTTSTQRISNFVTPKVPTAGSSEMYLLGFSVVGGALVARYIL